MAHPHEIPFDFDTLLLQAQDLLQQERDAPCDGLEALQAHRLRRAEIRRLFRALQEPLSALRQQLDELPLLPPEAEIRWSQAVLALPNLRLLEIDTTGLQSSTDEIVRLTLVDRAGELVADHLIQPVEQPLTPHVSEINGITPEELETAPPLTTIWEQIRQELQGCYLVSFNQSFDLGFLSNAASRFQLDPITFIGEDLQQHTTRYFQEYGLSLASLCERIGHPLAQRPQQRALDRARGQWHLLQAMAQGFVARSTPGAEEALPATSEVSSVPNDTIDFLEDDQPF